MKLLILLFGVLIYSAYFYGISGSYFSFAPFLLLLLLGIFYIVKYKQSFSTLVMQPYYLFLFSWLLINISLFCVLFVLGSTNFDSILSLLGLNAISLICGYFLKIDYAEKISYTTYLLVTLTLIIYSFFDIQLSSLIVSLYLLIFTLVLICMIRYGIGRYYSTGKYFAYHIFIISILLIALLVLVRLDISLFSFLLLGIFFALLVIIIFSLSQRTTDAVSPKNITVRQILAGERILPYLKKKSSSNIVPIFQQYFRHAPLYLKYFLEGFNLIVFISFLFFYFIVYHTGFFGSFDVSYWIVIILFLGNIFFFRKMQYVSAFQKFGMFLGINIVIYSIFFSFFSAITSLLVLYLVLVNILFSVVISNLPKIFSLLVWTRYDYIFAWVVDVFVMVANIVLLSYLDISGQIIFALVSLYLAIKLLLFFVLYTKLPFHGSHQE